MFVVVLGWEDDVVLLRVVDPDVLPDIFAEGYFFWLGENGIKSVHLARDFEVLCFVW